MAACVLRYSSTVLIHPIHTERIQSGDDLATIFTNSNSIQSDDILVVSSKVVAVAEGAEMDLSTFHPTEAARGWAEKCGRRTEFCEAVIRETARLNGRIVGACHGALLTELRPSGLAHGVIMVANAGLDESNVAKGQAVGWPRDPVASARMLREKFLERLRAASCELRETTKLEARSSKLEADIGIIISDSRVLPHRLGVTAFALTVSGLHPHESQVGRRDLCRKPLLITTEAVADQLAVSANFVMGNAEQRIPAAIIRGHGLALTDFEGWVEGIEPSEDLFTIVLQEKLA